MRAHESLETLVDVAGQAQPIGKDPGEPCGCRVPLTSLATMPLDSSPATASSVSPGDNRNLAVLVGHPPLRDPGQAGRAQRRDRRVDLDAPLILDRQCVTGRHHRKRAVVPLDQNPVLVLVLGLRRLPESRHVDEDGVGLRAVRRRFGRSSRPCSRTGPRSASVRWMAEKSCSDCHQLFEIVLVDRAVQRPGSYADVRCVREDRPDACDLLYVD